MDHVRIPQVSDPLGQAPNRLWLAVRRLQQVVAFMQYYYLQTFEKCSVYTFDGRQFLAVAAGPNIIALAIRD